MREGEREIEEREEGGRDRRKERKLNCNDY